MSIPEADKGYTAIPTQVTNDPRISLRGARGHE